MREIRKLINEVLDRKVRYGGPSFLLNIRNVHRAVRQLIPADIEMGGFTGLSRLIIKELERRNAQPWGYGFNSSRRKEQLMNQIWQMER